MTMNGHGTVVMVTGATDGIGRETALELARQGARVLVHGRSAPRAEELVKALLAIRPEAALEPVLVDLSRLEEVRRVGQLLDARKVRVDVLVNNAGVFMNERRTSADGYEMTLAVNHLAPFAFTHALLAADAGQSLKRIVNVSSVAHLRGTLALDDLGFERRSFNPYSAYAASKLANLVFSVELAKRLSSRHITVNALHPGVVSTKLLTEGFGVQGSDSLAEGAATSVYLALSPDVATMSGRYFSEKKPAPTNPVAGDLALAKRFYELSAQLAGVTPLPES
jgi:NAD(P)-dependent dehydrogenase (short-subunit alcohol dehydrogenase family)